MIEKDSKIILKKCNVILDIDIKNHWKESIPTVDFENFQVCLNNGENGITLIYRTINQLKQKLETDAFKYLPAWCDEVGETRANQTISYSRKLISLEVVLENLKTNILKLDNKLISNEMAKIIRYQMRYSFWDSSDINIYNSDEINIANKLDELNKATIAIDRKIEELKKAKSAFDSIIQEAPQKLDSIEKALRNAENSETSINSINTDVATIKGTLSAVLVEQNTNTENFKKKLDEFQIKDESYQTKLDEIELQKNRIEEDKLEIENKKIEIEEIIGLVSNGALVYAFLDRAKSLIKNVRIWMFINFLFFVISCAWLMFSFELSNSFAEFLGITNSAYIEKNVEQKMVVQETPINDKTISNKKAQANPIQNIEENDLAKLTSTILLILASGFKILPVWLLMQFGFKNYTRERRTLEAYEFKAAVAATINNYAEQMISNKYALKREDFGETVAGIKEWEKYVNERDKDRKDLIRNTVDNLYKEVKFDEDELNYKKTNTKEWKRLKEIISLVNNKQSSK